MSATMNVDDLFNQIDNLADSMKQAAADRQKSGGGTGNKKKIEYKNLDMTFLGTVIGNYELKVFVDGTGKLSEDVYMHSIKTGVEKVTVPCKGDGCELCALQQKLDGLKNKAAWKFARYKLNKILIKIGDIVEGAKSLKPGGTYVAYVDDKFFQPLVDTLRTNKKYYKDDITKMLSPTERSGGFLVTSTKGKKSITFNFNFIPTIGIEPLDVKEVFGTDKYSLANYGYFRNNYIPADKFKKAVSLLQNLLVATASNAGKSQPSESEKDEEEDDRAGDAAAEAASGTGTEGQATPPWDGESEQSTTATETAAKTEVKEEKKPDAPASKESVSVDPASITEDNVVRDSTKINSATSKPVCFAWFDPSNKTCSQNCQFKRDCLMSAMEEGRV